MQKRLTVAQPNTEVSVAASPAVNSRTSPPCGTVPPASARPDSASTRASTGALAQWSGTEQVKPLIPKATANGYSTAGPRTSLSAGASGPVGEWPEHTRPYAIDLDEYVRGAETQVFGLQSGCAEGVSIELWIGEDGKPLTRLRRRVDRCPTQSAVVAKLTTAHTPRSFRRRRESNPRGRESSPRGRGSNSTDATSHE